MKLQVRAMQVSDVDGVYAIEAVAHRAPWGRQILSDCVLVGYDCRVLEVEIDETPLLTSYIICRYNDTLCHILNLCVAPAMQGKGYGRMLLQQVIDFPKVPHIKHYYLEVRPSNQVALHLYETMGFQMVGIKPGYYNDVQGIEDAVVLQKQINGSLVG